MKKSAFLIFCFLLFSCHQINKTGKESANAGKITPAKNNQPVQRKVSGGCSYDNDVSTLGIGLVIAPSKFDVYNDSLLTDKSASYDMDNEPEKKINICPKFFKPDYGIMHFVCIHSTKKAYKVLINYDEVKFLPKREAYIFKSWPDYINESYGVRRLTPEGKNFSAPRQQPLKKAPHNNADTLAIPSGYEMFCPVEMKGDWIRVKFDCFYNDEDNKHEGEPCHNYIDQCKNPVTGWLKWREGNKLLVDIFLQP